MTNSSHFSGTSSSSVDSHSAIVNGPSYEVNNHLSLINFKTVVSEIKCPASRVNYCLKAKPSYNDKLPPFFDESSVERRIDRMLSCESLGF